MMRDTRQKRKEEKETRWVESVSLLDLLRRGWRERERLRVGGGDSRRLGRRSTYQRESRESVCDVKGREGERDKEEKEEKEKKQ